MDKNSIFGILLIAAILIIWGVFQAPDKKELEEQRRRADSARIAEQARILADTIGRSFQVDTIPQSITAPDSFDTQKLESELGEFAATAAGENKFYVIENDLIKLTVSSKGGRPYSVELKEYKDFNRQPVILFDGDSTQFGLMFYNQNKPVSTNELYFGAVDSLARNATVQRDSLIMKLTVNEGKYIEYSYVLEPGSYMVGFNIHLVGMKDIVTRDPSALDLTWEANIPQHEQLKKNEIQYTSLYFRHHKEDVDFFRAGANKDVQQQDIPTQVEWVAFKNQFFSSVIIADEAFSNALVKSTSLPEESKYLKNFRAELGIPFQRLDRETLKMKMFFGPNKFKLLKKYKEYKLEELVSVGKGIISWINRFVIIPIFDWLSRFIGNYGLIILLLTIIIKVALLPLTYKSYLSQARMKVLKPQVDELTAKYPKGKEVERQQATMALYKKAGISPMGGCLPMLLQFPILFAMFRFFPTSIELRQEAFLWAKDLSTYDPILTWSTNIPLLGDHLSLFNLLMTISTIISMKMSDTSATTQQMPGMKTMMYIMPVMFLFMLNNLSSGLTYYYFLANMITIGQNYFFKQMIDEKEILRKIEEKKSKPVKKSNFQKRLEEMSKQANQRTRKK
ncbi:MAG: membrane protein insertase YidC [Bacteroidales bacterium]|nr:membrane protein insertase YidC [Bacteroidales bacterium]